jgi:calcium-dependent protein kinase
MHLVRQIVSAIAHAHSENIVHQDLRPENILFATKDADARLVVTDWCYAEFIDTPPTEARKFLPVSDFSAPELDVHHRTDRLDIWSIGVLVFAMLTYRLPFDDGPVDGLPHWEENDGLSVECREFVNSMLKLNPKDRPSAKELLAHPLLSNVSLVPAKRDSVVDIAKAFVTFSGKSRLQKTAAAFAANHLSGEELHQLSELFDSMDTNGDGTIDRAELEASFEKLDWAEIECTSESQAESIQSKKERIAVLIHSLDLDGSGHISYTEFLSAAADSHMQSHVELCYEAFRAFDADGSGLVSRCEIDKLMGSPEIEELVEAIKRTRNKEVIEKALDIIGKDSLDSGKQIFEKLDKDGNKNISFDEFLKAVLGTPDQTS